MGLKSYSKKPSKPNAQQSTFSANKNRNTAKSLVGNAPSRMFSCVSDCHGGSTSDRQIAERSFLVSKVDSEESIMANEGFNVQNLFESSNGIINIPTFFPRKIIIKCIAKLF